jgi:medium-chain acyl-[acyl-carrier-protein] hydrolase
MARSNPAVLPHAFAAFSPVAPPVRDPRRADGWLVWPADGSDVRLRLFCFPYAGGSGTMFRSWRMAMPPGVDVCGVQLPGRGTRVRERYFRHIDTLVPALTEAILPLCDRPFAFFGHSVGALIAFEVARHLRRQKGPEPLLLIASGRRAPQLPSEQPPIYALPHDAFVEELRQLEGTPEEVLHNQELMDLLIPTLRADFEICDTYEFQPGTSLSVPIIAYGGADDRDDTPPKLAAWRSATDGPFSMRQFPGGHFFIHTAEPQLLRAVSADLAPFLANLPVTL